MSLQDTVDAFYRARARYEEADRSAKAFYKIKQTREREMIEAMLEAETKGVRREDGTYCGWKRNVRISVTQENDADIREWLLETTGDDSDFLATKCNKSAVEEHVKKLVGENEAIDADDDDDTEKHVIPQFFKLNQHPVANVTGWKQLDKEPYLDD